ncbi:MAG: serine/threonine protein kinase, partial [Planctomycetota bacterium]
SQIDHYRLLGKLGSGAMGSVYLADDVHGGTRVALKVINTRHVDDDEFINRFQREAKLVTQLDHPHIGRALSIGEVAGELYIALEYINGPSLADLLKSYGPMSETYLLRRAIEIGEGLNYAYTRFGLVHRDMKPENVLLERSDDGQSDTPSEGDCAKIIDFGLAKAIGTDQSLTMTGLTMGTPHYMAPEQICGRKDLDCRADIYGLGCTLYHLLTGKTPFRGDSPGGIMMAHINEPVPDPRQRVPGLQQATCDLLTMAMAKERNDRYLNFTAFIEACKTALSQIEGSQPHEMRLLRKPLVVKKPHVRKERNQQDTPSNSPNLPGPSNVEQHRKQVTKRIARKHAGDQGSRPHRRDSSAQGLQAENTDPFSEADQKAGNAEEALRAVQSDRHRQRNKKTAPRPRMHNTTPEVNMSAAFNPDAEVPRNLGLLPWIALLLALAVFAAIMLL